MSVLEHRSARASQGIITEPRVAITMITALHPRTRPTGTGPRPRIDPHPPRVLLATDDSDAARAGEEWVRRLRWARQPIVDVLTIAPRPGPAWRAGLQTYRTAVREAVLRSRETELFAAQRIANEVGSRLQRAGSTVHVWARQGDIADEIATTARLEGADMVVVGHAGRPRHALAWRRPVARDVAERADRTVLIAHRPAPGDDRLPRAPIVLVPDERAGEEALRWLASVGWLEGGTETLAYIGGSGIERPEDGQGSRRTSPVAAARSGLARDASVARSSEVWLGADAERLEAALPDLFARTGCDLLVLPQRWSGSGGEIPLGAAAEARVSVLLVATSAVPRVGSFPIR